MSEPQAMCACLHIEYYNDDTNGRVTKEWWACRDCATIYLKQRVAEAEKAQLQAALRNQSSVIAQLSEHIADLEAKLKLAVEVKQAAIALLDRLNVIHTDEPYKIVWILYMVPAVITPTVQSTTPK